jgi:hypothetical protein
LGAKPPNPVLLSDRSLSSWWQYSLKLIEGLTSIVPIISVEGGTHSITNKIEICQDADNKQK